MGFLKTLAIGTFVIIGGCTVTVGGCTYGVGKTFVEAGKQAMKVDVHNKFEEYYEKNPGKAEALYTKIATKCYFDSMREAMVSTVPGSAINERVKFDLYEQQILRMGNPEHIQHLDAWREQSEDRILSASKGKQKRELANYFKRMDGHNLIETMCKYAAFEKEIPKTSTRTASSLR